LTAAAITTALGLSLALSGSAAALTVETLPVSNNSLSFPGVTRSELSSISANGIYVAFDAEKETPSPVGLPVREYRTYRKNLLTGALDLIGPGRIAGQDSISSDGRYVLYINSGILFRKDFISGSIIQVADQTSSATMTPDGDTIAFASSGQVLPSDTNGKIDIYVTKISSYSVRRASFTLSGGEPNGASREPSLSSDGNYVAYESTATNMTPGASGQFSRVFRANLTNPQVAVEIVSSNASGAFGDNGAFDGEISADGRFVAFDSTATNLLASTTSGYHVYRKDMLTGAVLAVSTNTSGTLGDDHSYRASISGDGAKICFESTSTNLLSQPLYTPAQVYLKNLITGDIDVISKSTSGVVGNALSSRCSLSPDAHYASLASEWLLAGGLYDQVTENVFRVHLN
jgi:Tol biopolymer transport system component